jgi:hypothetical protein
MVLGEMGINQAKDRQSVPVNVDNATVDAIMVIINEYCSLYKYILDNA